MVMVMEVVAAVAAAVDAYNCDDLTTMALNMATTMTSMKLIMMTTRMRMRMMTMAAAVMILTGFGFGDATGERDPRPSHQQ